MTKSTEESMRVHAGSVCGAAVDVGKVPFYTMLVKCGLAKVFGKISIFIKNKQILFISAIIPLAFCPTKIIICRMQYKYINWTMF
jgi:hypothetical protein